MKDPFWNIHPHYTSHLYSSHNTSHPLTEKRTGGSIGQVTVGQPSCLPYCHLLIVLNPLNLLRWGWTGSQIHPHLPPRIPSPLPLVSLLHPASLPVACLEWGTGSALHLLSLHLSSLSIFACLPGGFMPCTALFPPVSVPPSLPQFLRTFPLTPLILIINNHHMLIKMLINQSPLLISHLFSFSIHPSIRDGRADYSWRSHPPPSERKS